METCRHVADGMMQGQTRTLNKLTDGDLSTVLWSDVGLDQNKYSYGVAIQSLVQNVEEILYICCRNVSILGLNATCISDILAGFDNATRFVFLFCQVLENLSALPLFCFFDFYFDIALSQNGYPRIRCKNTDSAAGHATATASAMRQPSASPALHPCGPPSSMRWEHQQHQQHSQLF